jgi:hypothetical protein
MWPGMDWAAAACLLFRRYKEAFFMRSKINNYRDKSACFSTWTFIQAC